MKRFLSVFLSVIMLLAFITVPAKADEGIKAGFAENTDVIIGLENYGVSITMYGVCFNTGSQDIVKIELYSGEELLACAYPRENISCTGSELTCPFDFDKRIRGSWTHKYESGFGIANKVPNRVDVTIGTETRTFNTYQQENAITSSDAREKWLSYTGAKSPIEPKTQETLVYANADPTFVVSIPRVVDFGKIQKSDEYKVQNFEVSVSNALIEADAKIVVKLTSDTIMKNLNGRQLPFKLIKSDGKTIVTKNNEFCSFDWGTLDKGNGAANNIGYVKCSTDNLTAAGNYTGTMTFAISYEYNN